MDEAIYPGSFDPITNGHLNILERALDVCGRIIVVVATNKSKASLFSPAEKLTMIREVTRDLPQVEVDHTDGLLVDYARSRGVRIAVRGLRAMTDFEGEFAMALTNRTLWPEFDSIFLMTKSEYMFLSSSRVKEIAQHGGDVSAFVPQVVEQRLKDKFGTA